MLPLAHVFMSYAGAGSDYSAIRLNYFFRLMPFAALLCHRPAISYCCTGSDVKYKRAGNKPIAKSSTKKTDCKPSQSGPYPARTRLYCGLP